MSSEKSSSLILVREDENDNFDQEAKVIDKATTTLVNQQKRSERSNEDRGESNEVAQGE